jgi:hypothetical protein
MAIHRTASPSRKELSRGSLNCDARVFRMANQPRRYTHPTRTIAIVSIFGQLVLRPANAAPILEKHPPPV